MSNLTEKAAEFRNACINYDRLKKEHEEAQKSTEDLFDQLKKASMRKTTAQRELLEIAQA